MSDSKSTVRSASLLIAELEHREPAVIDDTSSALDGEHGENLVMLSVFTYITW
jgi:hypothetical protein